MWLFFFPDSEHRAVSKDLEKLKKYIKNKYDITEWKFVKVDQETIQVLDIHNEDKEEGFIVKILEV